MKYIENMIEKIVEYTDSFSVPGIIRLIIDIALVCFIVVVVYKLLRIKIHHKRIYLYVLGGIFTYLVIAFFELALTLSVLHFILFWSLGVLIIVYGQDIRHFIDNAFHSTTADNVFTSEQEKHEVINILVKTAGYLSKRRIGALITIEREDNLNNFIEKAIIIRGTISEELLTTLFTVGTPTHDGAVIIRKNRVMCAGAYLPSTDRYDVPKALGTRHRAAIGLSERFDAVTIVISEETGNISITADGVIDIGLSEDKLHEVLEQYLMVK